MFPPVHGAGMQCLQQRLTQKSGLAPFVIFILNGSSHNVERNDAKTKQQA